MSLSTRLAAVERKLGAAQDDPVREWCALPAEGWMAFMCGDPTGEWRARYPAAWRLNCEMAAALFSRPPVAERTPVAPAPVAEVAPAVEVAPADEVPAEPGPPPPRPLARYGAAAPRESARLLDDALDRAFSPRW